MGMLTARLIWFSRLSQLATASFFAFIVLGLSGNILSLFPSGFPTPGYAGLALATSVLTLITIIPIVVIDFFRKGAVTSLVVVELVWSSLLTILWLAAAADTTAALSGVSCSSVVNVPDGFGGTATVFQSSAAVTQCHEVQAIAAFSWLNFFNLGAWLVFLITASSIAHSRGNDRVWLGPVTGTEFFAPRGQNSAPMEYSAPQQGYMDQQQGYPYPQMQQQQYTGGPIPQQDPMSYPPNNGYSPGMAPQVQV